MEACVIPVELIVLIARCNWRAYSRLLTVCKQVNSELTKINPYELFIVGRLGNKMCYKWITADQRVIYETQNMFNDEEIRVKLFGRLTYQFNEEVFAIDRHTGITFRYAIHKLIQDEWRRFIVDENIWRKTLADGTFWQLKLDQQN